MATSPKNSLKRMVGGRKSMFMEAANVISSAVSFNQGDILYFDDTANLVKPVTADADGALVLGIAPVTVSSGQLLKPYSGLSDLPAGSVSLAIPGPIYGDIHEVILKTGDAFNPGDAVYATAVDAQTVSSAGTNVIGIYQGKAVATATAGQLGEILIGAKLKNGALLF